MPLSLLDIVKSNDCVSYNSSDFKDLYQFQSHDSIPLGLIIPEVAHELQSETDLVNIDQINKIITISNSLNTFEKRNEAFALLLQKWKSQNKFEPLNGWRNELYTVYCPSKRPYMLIERAGACLFGLVTYGVHIVGYVPDSNGVPCKIWVPRRSYSKPTYPGMLDNTVAGGIGYPYSREQTVIKECEEEAGLSEEYVTNHIKSTGVISYFFKDPDVNLFQPEVEYTYDLIMEPGIEPKPTDGEVQEFNLMTIDEVLEELPNGSFKYNAGLITIDFLIRHGFITPEKEKDYQELVLRMHRRLEYPLM